MSRKGTSYVKNPSLRAETIMPWRGCDCLTRPQRQDRAGGEGAGQDLIRSCVKGSDVLEGEG